MHKKIMNIDYTRTANAVMALHFNPPDWEQIELVEEDTIYDTCVYPALYLPNAKERDQSIVNTLISKYSEGVWSKYVIYCDTKITRNTFY